MKKAFLFFTLFFAVFTAISAQTCTLKAVVDSITHVSCYTSANGAIYLKVINAQPPVTFKWVLTGQTSPNIYNLPAGLYSVIVSDNSGCRDTLSNIKINQDTPKITITTTPATNGVNGKATIRIIKNADTLSREFINLKVGVNNVYITDRQACGYSLSVTITGVTASNELNTEGLEKFNIVQNAPNNVAISVGFSELKAFDLSVFTVSGQCVLDQSFKEKEVLFNLNTHDLASGLLLFQLKIKDKMVIKKLILN